MVRRDNEAACVLAFLIPYIACGGSGGGVRRTIENGAEVVLNPAELPQTENKPPALAIEKIFAVDTEDGTTAAMGVTDIAEFDVDGAGNILILVPPTGPRMCIHKLTKNHVPVPVAAEYKTKFLEPYLEFMPDYAKKIYFPESWHPFQAFFPDEAGRLFVVTFEPGDGPGEYMADVFDPDGILVHRVSLAAFRGSGGSLLARIRGDRLYAVEEKESGYKRLNVYRLMWR